MREEAMADRMAMVPGARVRDDTGTLVHYGTVQGPVLDDPHRVWVVWDEPRQIQGGARAVYTSALWRDLEPAPGAPVCRRPAEPAAATALASEQPTPVPLPPGVPESSEYARWGWSDVTKERLRQDAKWGVSRNLHPQLWLAVLVEEVGEVGQAILNGEIDNYREELVQVAAVALAAIQDFDWQSHQRDRLPPPQVVAFGWERAERQGDDGDN